jgi:hypothetical protein
LEAVNDCEYEIYVQLANNSPLEMILDLNGTELSSTISETNFADQVQSPDRIPRGEVYERNWPLAYLGKGRFEQGKVKLTLRANTKENGELEIKSVILKELDSSLPHSIK